MFGAAVGWDSNDNAVRLVVTDKCNPAAVRRPRGRNLVRNTGAQSNGSLGVQQFHVYITVTFALFAPHKCDCTPIGSKRRRQFGAWIGGKRAASICPDRLGAAGGPDPKLGPNRP